MKKFKTIICLMFVLICGTLLFTACGPNKDIDPTPTYCIVTFDTCGGSNIDNIQVEKGQLINEPTQPTKVNYKFAGWYIDSNYNYEFRFAVDTINSDTILYAKWTKSLEQYTITFNTNGGNALSAITQNEGTSLNLPTPTKSGYTFDYWYTDNSQPFTATTMPSHNVNLYAKWKVAVEVYVDGNLYDTIYTNEDNDYILTNLKKPEDITTNPMIEKYFYGYFLDPYFNVQLAETTTFTTNSRIYAKWINIDYSKYSYYVSDGGAVITEYKEENATIAIIPEYINSFPVKSIYGRDVESGTYPFVTTKFVGAFENMTTIREIIYIGNQLSTIKNGAFRGCTSLTSIGNIPSSVKTLGGFGGCTGLKSLTIPDTVTSVMGFTDCTNLTDITIPSSVTNISGFTRCTKLTDITIPGTVENLGGFSGCTGLKTLSISNGVKYISAFENCTGLTSITIPSSVETLKGFKDCTGLTSITLEYGLKTLGGLTGCTGLTSIEIPSSVENIEYYAFYNCSKLTSITIPSSVESIGQYAFNGCTGLTSITIPSSVETIYYGAFQECTGLTSVTLEYGVTSIGDDAFASCKSLTNIALPSSVTCLGSLAFARCDNLKSIYIPKSITTMGAYIFRGCNSSILKVYCESVNSDWDYRWKYTGQFTSNDGSETPSSPAKIYYSYTYEQYLAEIENNN